MEQRRSKSKARTPKQANVTHYTEIHSSFLSKRLCMQCMHVLSCHYSNVKLAASNFSPCFLLNCFTGESICFLADQGALQLPLPEDKSTMEDASLKFKPNEAFKEQSVWHFEMESKNYTYCNSLGPFESAIHFVVFLTVSCLLRDCGNSL